MLQIRNPKTEIRTAKCSAIASILGFGSRLQNLRGVQFPKPFPLTPALSLRERENQAPHRNVSKRLLASHARPTMLPLPEGEGWGEGERIMRIPERWGFC